MTIFRSKTDFSSANSRFTLQNDGTYLPLITNNLYNVVLRSQSPSIEAFTFLSHLCNMDLTTFGRSKFTYNVVKLSDELRFCTYFTTTATTLTTTTTTTATFTTTTKFKMSALTTTTTPFIIIIWSSFDTPGYLKALPRQFTISENVVFAFFFTKKVGGEKMRKNKMANFFPVLKGF